MVINWYKKYYFDKKENIFDFSKHQLKSYLRKLNKMNVVILAGGLGTRLSEYTKEIPKPMVRINKIPIIIHIINHYAKFGLNNFYIAAGYKKNVITNYFKKEDGSKYKSN